MSWRDYGRAEWHHGGYGDRVKSIDFLVVGAGIIGLNVALALKKKYKDSSVLVIDKERVCGEHASGRNSGVLHAGFYYTADSLKAKFTREGNRLLTEYCNTHNLPINKCGKLVIARNEEEDNTLDELLRRAKNNGVVLEEVTEEEARKIEPRVKTYRRALFSPTTASADPQAVLESMENDAKSQGVELQYSVEFVKRTTKGVQTTNGIYNVGYLVNAAGLYADKVAKEFGYSQDYAILPFKGLYLKSAEAVGAYHTNIYPVPDLRNPFLGVHFTVQVNGRVKIGPTAIPGMWREHYNGIKNFRLNEFMDVAPRLVGLLFSSNISFTRLAYSEIKKYSRRHLVSLAKGLATAVDETAFKEWAKPGIRAQLIDVKRRKLEMDFVLEGDKNSMHILNAVSPGWTCSIPFAQFVVDEISNKFN
jgi:L-2-hydroxyglutarate oxidase